VSALPLAGRTVLVTRTREQAGGLVDKLHALGATVVVVPLLSTVPLLSPGEVGAAVERLLASPAPRWAVFTSATAVRLVLGAIEVAQLAGIAIACVGAETAAALAAAGCSPRLVPARQDATGLADALAAEGVAGATVWLPAAEGASPLLPRALSDAGAAVIEQRLYRSAMPPDAADRLRAALDRGADAVTLTSGSTARHLAEALGGTPLDPRVALVCIGAATASAARGSGLRVDAVAADPSAAGIAEALAAHFAAVP